MPKYHTPTARALAAADLTIRNLFNQVLAQVLIQLLQLLTFLTFSGRPFLPVPMRRELSAIVK
jgi:hypothetical protein